MKAKLAVLAKSLEWFKIRMVRPVVLSPRESGQFIAENAKHVKVHDAGATALAKLFMEELSNGSRNLNLFTQCHVHPSAADVDAVNWIFLIDTLNFCFWSGKPEKWEVTVRGKTYTGYLALCAAIIRAKEEGVDITDPKYFACMTLKELTHVLRGDDLTVSVPLLKERLECLHQVGQILLEQYDGDFSNCIKACNNSATNLMKLIVSKFKCFQDETDFMGKRVGIYKRAQILVGDIWVCFQGKGIGCFTDIEELTMFADYRVPQVLIQFKALDYDEHLMETLKKGTILETGCQEEVEIRGCSIEAVERIVAEVRRMMPGVKCNSDEQKVEGDEKVCNAVTVDHFLWDYRRRFAKELEHIPFHKTLSIYY